MLNVGRNSKAIAVAVAAFVGFGFTGAAHASVIAVQNVTASSAFGGFEAAYAIDDPTAMTDWATNGQQTGGYLQFDLGSAQPLGIVSITDRVTSGGPQGVYTGQTNDFTTSYTVQAYTDATFTTKIGPAITNTETAPAHPSSLASFQTTANLAGVRAEFVQYTINAANGANPGLEDITFNTATSTVPEPASILTLLLGVGICWAMRRNGKPI